LIGECKKQLTTEFLTCFICKPGEAMASKWRGSAVEGAVEWTRRRLSSPFTNLRSYSFANQAKQCGWGCSEIDVAATWIFQRKFVPYSYYIRTISPYLYDIRTISVRYPKRTSAVRPYDVRTASVRRPYGVFTASLRSLYGVFTVFVRYLAVHPPYIRLMGCTDPFPSVSLLVRVD